MKKIFLLAVLALFSLSACVPGFLGGGAEEAPAAEPVDIAATVDAEASTQAVQTLDALDALATPTMEPATPTEEPIATATEMLVLTEEATATHTETPEGTPSDEAEMTETPDGTPVENTDEATATSEATATLIATGTPAATATSVYPSPTSPISINLPPIGTVPYHRIEISNKTKGPVYISLQGSTEGGYKPIIEYDIPKWTKVKVSVPEGFYAVVVYVGAHPMIDYVSINSSNVSISISATELKITK